MGRAATRSPPAPTRRRSPLRPRRPAADHVRRAPGVGEDPRRRQAASPPTPRRRRSSTRPSPPPSRSRAPHARGRPPTRSSATWDFLDEAAFAGVRQLVGLDEVEFAITGAAPIPPELLEWYRAIGVPLSEIYGMSETTGPMTWDAHGSSRAPSGGHPRLRGQPRRGRRGHLPRRQRLRQGYLDDPEKTAEALDRTAGSTPATSAVSTTTATSGSSTARRS